MSQNYRSDIPQHDAIDWPADYRAPEIVTYGAIELSNKIHSREVSCAEVMEAYLKHIESLNPVVNAIVSLKQPQELFKEAHQCDIEISKGNSRGWLHGIPLAIKDLSSTYDIKTTLGSPLFKDQIPSADSFMVSRIRNSGAILIGKTNTPEFGLGSQTFNSVFGITRNAYDTRLTAGGSSGGAAAALALNMLPVADGSDMMGSLRNPAAYHNIYGLRPTFGRIPSGPAPEIFCHQLGTEGPMARNVDDLQRLLATQAGHEPRSPLTLTDDPSRLLETLGSNQKGTRIGWLKDWDGELPMEEGVIDLCEDALRIFEHIGCEVENAPPPMAMSRIWESWTKLRQWAISGNLADLYNDTSKRKLLKPEAQWEIREGLSLSAHEIHKASVARSHWYSTLHQQFKDYDFLVLPSAQCFPFPATTPWPSEISGREMDTYHRWMQVVVPGSLSGCPILNMPAGFSSKGLPMGIQVIAPHRSELSLLKLAKAYEEAAPDWKKRKPQIIENNKR
ncbi:amidase [Halomonas ventosae]|uniref:Amidase n=1 Tax=Halomonas ventosae TaxID=229007 RepID=A0A4R6ZMJ4_9GAMM|nr:amidase [Halomonas ventosae]TDR53299.1 amidase [Halomonas ventosae]